MKTVVLLIILFCIFPLVCFSQKSTPVVKPTAAKSSAAKPSATKPSAAKPIIAKQTTVQPIKEIVPDDWQNLIDAVQSENWEKSSQIANAYFTKLKSENDKKQIARLRYILLYSLAAKIVDLSAAERKTEEAKARAELEQKANAFLDKEFFMPSREVASDCEGKLNYVCRSKQQQNVLRTTATNQEAKAIYSFEYVRLKENYGFLKNVGKQVVLSGILKKVEFNPDKSNVWIMRLFFEDGSVNVVPVQ